ncbi:solute carrier family 25 member 38 [Gaeumannomyces tritici R3-111a-1]|uniref:Mitochondrial glycine transporter n=1 Tax=Gaeumannomyces tritici (strain R3-111a-1) TaxID=644352 RepID=J3NJ52_GAET3|nr:solute carrier family 25 member 38 [Gaeumannomyces tritici R3-111a-1]EJT81302.1 solute carrier family 25 member 38 [Gaeumannomyces tritici R3-111a-1]
MSNGSGKGGSKSSFHFVAGLGSGVLSAALLQPIDLLKTRVQQSGHHSLARSLAEIRASPAGLRGLWRGTVPSALRTGFGSALYFSSLNAIRKAAAVNIPFLAVPPPSSGASRQDGRPHVAGGSSSSNGSRGGDSSSSRLVKLSNTGNMLAGATARGFAGFVLMPLTVIKVRYESSLYAYRSIAGAGRDILRSEGPRGFFAGFGATAIRDAPYAGLYVLLYEQAKRRLSALSSSRSVGDDDGGNDDKNKNNKNNNNNNRMGVSRAAAVNFSSGVLAATACSVVSNPFDAVKTRIQLQPHRYRNMLRAAATMLAEEGARSLWDGLALRMTRKALSSALAWTVYEELIMRAELSWSVGGGGGAQAEKAL